jgi:hypothetical protein
MDLVGVYFLCIFAVYFAVYIFAGGFAVILLVVLGENLY